MGRGGSGEKKRREFLCLLPNAGGGQEPDRVRHGRLVFFKAAFTKPCIHTVRFSDCP